MAISEFLANGLDEYLPVNARSRAWRVRIQRLWSELLFVTLHITAPMVTKDAKLHSRTIFALLIFPSYSHQPSYVDVVDN
ncbi:hypothetical protein N7509_006466 [Penicillium cosmopolitanum]|uniref:Uncharacterized protein n=1 Tax=Penicillium cosmopolitanum TaxID=1131564 RepID=A0A9W9W0H2_9EURO|nr:uncharacterized protein N7509_006466 [Penicillium cosmopolitanum]KAJ5394679.1 hypothetical protein N7509_006466 [Penicillium cosmopolitanum]